MCLNKNEFAPSPPFRKRNEVEVYLEKKKLTQTGFRPARETKWRFSLTHSSFGVGPEPQENAFPFSTTTWSSLGSEHVFLCCPAWNTLKMLVDIPLEVVCVHQRGSQPKSITEKEKKKEKTYYVHNLLQVCS